MPGPGISYFVILIVICPQIVGRHLYSMICTVITISEPNLSLAFLLYIRILVLTHDLSFLDVICSYLYVQKLVSLVTKCIYVQLYSIL